MSKDTSLIDAGKQFGMAALQQDKGGNAIPKKKANQEGMTIVTIKYTDMMPPEQETRSRSSKNPPPPLRFENGVAQALMECQFKTIFWYEAFCSQRSQDLMMNLFGQELDKVEELLYACDLQMLE